MTEDAGVNLPDEVWQAVGFNPGEMEENRERYLADPFGRPCAEIMAVEAATPLVVATALEALANDLETGTGFEMTHTEWLRMLRETARDVRESYRD